MDCVRIELIAWCGFVKNTHFGIPHYYPSKLSQSGKQGKTRNFHRPEDIRKIGQLNATWYILSNKINDIRLGPEREKDKRFTYLVRKSFYILYNVLNSQPVVCNVMHIFSIVTDIF